LLEDFQIFFIFYFSPKQNNKTHFAVVSHEQHSMARVYFAGTKVARLNSHVEAVFLLLQSLKIDFFLSEMTKTRGEQVL
jgi:hypothetical protein